MTKKEMREWDKSMAEQLAEVKSSKTAAKKLLAQLGILDKCVPKGTSKAASRSGK